MSTADHSRRAPPRSSRPSAKARVQAHEQTAHKGKRERTKQRNRSVLLKAAREVFIELGYDAATVRDIVARTRLAPGTFYNYFPDKRSVLVALMNEVGAEAARLAHAARSEARTLEELAYLSFRAYFEFVVSDRTAFELMRRNASTLRTLGIDETGFAEALAQLHSDLEAAIARGTLPPIPLHYVPSVVGAIAFEVGALMTATDPPDVEGATQFAAEICLGGIERLQRLAQGRAPRTKTTGDEHEAAEGSRRRRDRGR